jgi:DNA topoisomerase-2
MTWTKNMSSHSEPDIENYSGKDFVKVTFYPCFDKFNMENGLDDEIVSLLTKRVYDMAGIMPRIKVSLN